jgi:chromosome segregation ATPase
MMMRQGFLFLSAVMAADLAGCGGGLKYKVDDAALDSVPTGERQSVFSAQNEIEVAKSERRQADSQLEALERDQDVAKAEKKQAELEIEKANTEDESAVASHDENRHNAALHGKQVAAMGVKVVEAKLDWLDQKQDWLKAMRDAADAHQKAAEAKVELEKARVAKQKGIKPGPDFSVDDYESQWKSKDGDWQSAKKDSESQEKRTKEREQKWKDLADEQGKLRG